MSETFQKTLGVLFITWALAAVTGYARVDEALLDELCGIEPNPARKATELHGLYLEAFSSVKARLGSKVEGDRTKTQQRIRAMANYVGQPDAEAQRKIFCGAVAKQLEDLTYPALGRHLLIRSLGEVGGAESIPVLVKLIGSQDKIESDMARMSLQQIPGGEADAALVAALKASTDKNLRIGLIDSIGARRPASAVAPLSALLDAPEAEVAAAAATCLGKIGDPVATKALGAARSKSTDKEAQKFLELALLDIAGQRGRAGDREGAGKIFLALGKNTQHLAVRTASMLGIARAAPNLADQIVILAVQSSNQRMRSAGISAAISVPSQRLATGMAKMLDTHPKNVQLQILDALAAKGDLIVQAKVVEFLKKQEGKDEDLEVAAIRALGALGSVQVVELLLQKSIAKSAAVRNAAIASLAEVKGQDIAQTVEFHARQGKTPELRAVAIGLFMRNRDRSGLTRVIAFAAEADTTVSRAAFSVLRKEASDREFRPLLDLLTANKLAVLPVLKSVCDRAENPDLITSEIVTFLRGTENDRYKRFMMECLSVLGSPRGLPVLLEYVAEGKTSSDPAMKALSEWPRSIALPEMLKILEKRKTDRVAVVLMAKGISRLAGNSTDLSIDQRATYLSEAFEFCPNARERLLLLQAMGQVPHKLTAEIVEKMLTDKYVATVAAGAATSLSEKLAKTNPDMAKNLAIRVTKGGFNSALRSRAQAVISQLDRAGKESP